MTPTAKEVIPQESPVTLTESEDPLLDDNLSAPSGDALSMLTTREDPSCEEAATHSQAITEERFLIPSALEPNSPRMPLRRSPSNTSSSSNGDSDAEGSSLFDWDTEETKARDTVAYRATLAEERSAKARILDEVAPTDNIGPL